jgi:hypothetical protein
VKRSIRAENHLPGTAVFEVPELALFARGKRGALLQGEGLSVFGGGVERTVFEAHYSRPHDRFNKLVKKTKGYLSACRTLQLTEVLQCQRSLWRADPGPALGNTVKQLGLG